eukprot:TRINITY_DN4790_c0_g1_i2.p1 TRINITY_DN4790_c0_g1~~TRINITY_DN4790_c0_g1_i2.p1  ORF type:complete len:345 (-),score=63.16 TRINITY_DN4790_c0_g1_i2:21-1055(-)
MAKVYIIHENPDWIPALFAALEHLGVPHADLNVAHSRSFCLDDSPPEGVFFSRMSASSHTRGHRFAVEHTTGLLDWLARHGRVVVNGLRALQLEVSKVLQYNELQKRGVPVPRTIAVTGTKASGLGAMIEQEAQRHFGTGSFVTKPNRSGKGLGVFLFHSPASARAYVESEDFEEPVDGVTLLQQYVPSPTKTIVRSEFVDGKYLYSVKVDASDGFLLCPADACAAGVTCAAEKIASKFELLPSTFVPPYLQQYLDLMKANGVKVCGIEQVTDAAGTVWTYDININTNYNAAAEKIAFGESFSPQSGQMSVARMLKTLLEAEYGEDHSGTQPAKKQRLSHDVDA